MDLNSLFDSRVDVVFARVLTEHQINGESSTGDDENGHITKKVGEFRRVHRGRCDDQFQILSATHNLINIIS